MSAEWLHQRAGVRHDEPLARHSQFGVGGPADHFIKITEVEQLPELVRRCTEEEVPLTVLGAGSNTLILDGGIRGLAVRIADKRMRILDGDVAELNAGCMMPRAALDLAREGLAGMEWGIGVPGCCGASVYGNAGAFGSEVKDVLADCTVVAPDGTVQVMPAADCGFAYRDSRFKHDLRGHLVLSARFACRRDDPAAVRARTDEIQRQRKATQPYGVRSLGSTFKNPPGDHAGRLLEAAGLKGRRVGGAEVSAKHANFIVNAQSATAQDVLALMELMHDTVAERFGVDLEREVIILGEAAAPVAPR